LSPAVDHWRAVAVFLDKLFTIGNRIQIDAVDGNVESIGWRSTRIRNLNGQLVTIPNKTVGNTTIINVAARLNIETVMNVSVTYDTAVELIGEVFRGHAKRIDLVMRFN